MAARCDFFFLQNVQESELDLAFDQLEQADRDLASDIGIYGIVGGAVPVQHTPVADLTIDLTPPGRAYDHVGRRIFFGSEQRVDCVIDHTGIPTDVSTAGNERWLGVFLKFDRLLSDPRTDGNSQEVFFRRDESFQIIVRQGAEEVEGFAQKVPLVEDEVLVCDIRRTAGQTQIFDPDIDTSRRQAFIFATGDAIEILSAGWSTIQPTANTVQAALDSADNLLTGHFNGSGNRHPAGDIEHTPHGFIEATDVQGAIDEVVDDLSATDPSGPGASLIGADAVTGTPNSLPPSHVAAQLAQLLSWLNSHLAQTTGAHAASTISAIPYGYIVGTTIQAQVFEIIYRLAMQDVAQPGAGLVGNADISGTPYALSAETLRNQLQTLLGYLNAHTNSADHDERYFTEGQADARFYNVGEQVGDAHTVDGEHASAFANASHSHDGRYYTETESDGRFYNVGEKVGDADTLDTRHASYFATAGHDHDTRYLREIFTDTSSYGPGVSKILTQLEEIPDLVTFTYAVAESGYTHIYVNGPLTDQVKVFLREIPGGTNDKDYSLRIENNTLVNMDIAVHVYRIN